MISTDSGKNMKSNLVTGTVLVPLAFLLLACSGKSGGTADGNSAKFRQYFLQGQQLYNNNCSNCHQKEGTGLGLVYPPLDTSDYMDNNMEEVICLIRYGMEEPVLVNGKEYIQPMPGAPTLTDLEIAEIATYIYNNWNRNRGLVEVAEVADILNACSQ